MAKMKEAFITRSAKVVESAVNTKLAEELKSLKEDITAARTVNFGKKYSKRLLLSTRHLT